MSIRGIPTHRFVNNKAINFISLKRKNPSAKVEIDLSGLVEPDLSFLMAVAPWAEAFHIYIEKNGKAVHRKEIIEMLTRKNLMDSPLSPEILNRIVHTEKNLADQKLEGLREILEPMISQGVFDNQKAKYENGLVDGMIIHKSHLPERLLEEAGQYLRTGAAGYVPPDAGLSECPGCPSDYEKPGEPACKTSIPDISRHNKADSTVKVCNSPPGFPHANVATA